MKNTLLFCTGASGSGKTYFIQNTLPPGLFYCLRSATTRPMRPGERDGEAYFFRNEDYFNTTPLATYLWVNQAIWKPETPKWLYGVPETEIFNNLGRNLIYDVIEPKYVRQMIDWFNQKGLDAQYAFKIAYFVPSQNNTQIVAQRANMPDDSIVRTQNKCDIQAFNNVGLVPDYTMCPINDIYDKKLFTHIKRLQKQR